jgi:hypothetical protein
MKNYILTILLKSCGNYAAIILLSAFTVFFLSGCVESASLYAPNKINAPLLANKGAARFEGSVGEGVGTQKSQSTQYNLSFGFSPLDHVGFIGGFSNFYSSQTSLSISDNSGFNVKGKMGELGGGYYTSWGGNIKIVADCYGGIGFGNLAFTDGLDADMQYTRFFLQPGIGVHSGIIDVALSARMSYLNYQYMTAANSFAPYQDIMPANGSNALFLEPGLTIRFAFIQLQVTHSTAMKALNWNYDETNVNLGFRFSLGDCYAKTKTSKRYDY